MSIQFQFVKHPVIGWNSSQSHLSSFSFRLRFLCVYLPITFRRSLLFLFYCILFNRRLLCIRIGWKFSFSRAFFAILNLIGRVRSGPGLTKRKCRRWENAGYVLQRTRILLTLCFVQSFTERRKERKKGQEGEKRRRWRRGGTYPRGERSQS